MDDGLSTMLLAQYRTCHKERLDVEAQEERAKRTPGWDMTLSAATLAVAYGSEAKAANFLLRQLEVAGVLPKEGE